MDDLSRLSVNLSLPADSCDVEPTSNTNHSLLLNNIQKIEGTTYRSFFTYALLVSRFLHIHVINASLVSLSSLPFLISLALLRNNRSSSLYILLDR